MWDQRSSLLTHSTSFVGVLLTRLAHAVGLASEVGVAGVAVDATGDKVPATATAAEAIASLHPRRRPYRALIVKLPSWQRKLASIVVDEPWHATAVNVLDAAKMEITAKERRISGTTRRRDDRCRPQAKKQRRCRWRAGRDSRARSKRMVVRGSACEAAHAGSVTGSELWCPVCWRQASGPRCPGPDPSGVGYLDRLK
jgi:hypothetical protein